MKKVFKKIKRISEERFEPNIQQMLSTHVPRGLETSDKSQLPGSELFSLFTANIIKEEKVFTR